MSGHAEMIERLRKSSSTSIGYYGCQGCMDGEREDAADAIAALVAERDALRKANEWQPLNTAPLGDDFRDPPAIMVWVTDGGDKGTGCSAFGRAYRSHDGSVRAVASGFSGNWTITHWRPMPEPPALSHQQREEGK